jgi:hypothetical protein
MFRDFVNLLKKRKKTVRTVMGVALIFLGLFVIRAYRVHEVVVKVGRYPLTRRQVELRQDVSRVYYPESKRDDVGFIQLVQAYTLAEIFANNGREITPDQLEQESARIDANSRDRKTLNKVQDVFRGPFGMSKKDYLDIFILPNYAERMIHDGIFRSLASINEEPRNQAQDFYDSVEKNPSSFLAKAAADKRMHGSLCVGAEEGVVWKDENTVREEKARKDGPTLIDQSKKDPLEMEIRGQLDEEYKRYRTQLVEKWMTDLVRPNSPGTVLKQIVDHEANWYVLRLKSKQKNGGCFDAVRFPKPDFNQWLNAEKAKVKVEEFAKK